MLTGPALGKTSMTKFTLVVSDVIQTKTSVMSVDGSALAAGPSWWSAARAVGVMNAKTPMAAAINLFFMGSPP
jgi:hypothetical protein